MNFGAGLSNSIYFHHDNMCGITDRPYLRPWFRYIFIYVTYLVILMLKYFLSESNYWLENLILHGWHELFTWQKLINLKVQIEQANHTWFNLLWFFSENFKPIKLIMKNPVTLLLDHLNWSFAYKCRLSHHPSLRFMLVNNIDERHNTSALRMEGACLICWKHVGVFLCILWSQPFRVS